MKYLVFPDRFASRHLTGNSRAEPDCQLNLGLHNRVQPVSPFAFACSSRSSRAAAAIRRPILALVPNARIQLAAYLAACGLLCKIRTDLYLGRTMRSAGTYSSRPPPWRECRMDSKWRCKRRMSCRHHARGVAHGVSLANWRTDLASQGQLLFLRRVTM
jgi:hypothetical protein